MEYPAYRKAGLPVTTAWMESLVKEVNYRVKGSQCFGTIRRGRRRFSRSGRPRQRRRSAEPLPSLASGMSICSSPEVTQSSRRNLQKLICTPGAVPPAPSCGTFLPALQSLIPNPQSLAKIDARRRSPTARRSPPTTPTRESKTSATTIGRSFSRPRTPARRPDRSSGSRTCPARRPRGSRVPGGPGWRRRST